MVIENPLMPPRLGVGTIPNVVPFTMRENFAQMGLVEGMRHWIVTDLIPFVNGNIDKLSTEWVAQVNSLIDQFETITTGLVSDVNEAVEEIGTSVTDAQVAQAAAEAARDLAEQFASQAQEVQDASVTVILNDEDSQLRSALQGLFAPLAGYTTLYDTVTSGRLSGATLDTRFDGKADKTSVDAKNDAQDAAITAASALAASKADGSVQAVVESGRLSAAQMEASWGTKSGQEAIAAEVASIPRNGMPILVPGKKYVSMACVIRRVNATTWEFIDDGNHVPVGVSSISMTSTYVLITGNFVGKAVASCSVTPDETFSQAAVRVGASVGLSTIRVYFYMGAAGSAPVNPGLLSAAGANVWVYGVWEVE